MRRHLCIFFIFFFFIFFFFFFIILFFFFFVFFSFFIFFCLKELGDGLGGGSEEALCIFFFIFFIFFFSLEGADDRPEGGSEEGLMHLENGSRPAAVTLHVKTLQVMTCYFFLQSLFTFEVFFCIFLLFSHCR